MIVSQIHVTHQIKIIILKIKNIIFKILDFNINNKSFPKNAISQNILPTPDTINPNPNSN
jgi:hypothetical protein